MPIQYSAEIRWIIAGKALGSIKRWYEGDAFCNREKARIDYYLKFPGDEFVGIKLRKYPDEAQAAKDFSNLLNRQKKFGLLSAKLAG